MINYNEYLEKIPHTTEDIAGEIFDNDRNKIRIKKRHVAVRNLSLIIDATLSLCRTKGFRSMSLRDLSKEVGITMGGLYLYFRNKDDLIEIIQNQSIRTIQRITTDMDITSLKPREALTEVIRHYLYLSEANRKWFYFLYMETKDLSPSQKKKSVDLELFFENIFVEILDRGRSDGTFEVKNTSLMASMISAVLMDWFLKRHKYYIKHVSIDEYAEFVIDNIESLILAGR